MGGIIPFLVQMYNFTNPSIKAKNSPLFKFFDEIMTKTPDFTHATYKLVRCIEYATQRCLFVVLKKGNTRNVRVAIINYNREVVGHLNVVH